MMKVALLLLVSSQLAAQQAGSGSVWLARFHHDHARPDYATALVQGTAVARIELPPPPIVWGPLAYYTASRPDYLGELSPRQTVGPLIIPPPPPGEPPAIVRGIYLNAWTFGGSRFYDLIRLADSTEVNSFVIDVKDDTGYLTYQSSVPLAVEIGANGMIRASDASRRLALLRDRGIHAIARIVVAKDPLLAVRKPDWGVRHVNGGFWKDRIGTRWVDAYNDSIWVYAADIAAEAVMMGFAEVQFDYLRFPDEPRWMLDRAIFPGKSPGESQRAAIRRNVALMRERTAPLGVPFTLDIFGLTTSTTGDLGIGQTWEDLAPLADVVLPMVYPSHYRRGEYGIAHPNAEPYATVRRALEDGLVKNARLARAPRIRPYLQAFSIFRVRYTPAEIRAQIRAAEELGINEWVLWNPRGVYPAAALRPAVENAVALPLGTLQGDPPASSR